MSAGLAMRCCAISQATATTIATTRCATKPAESRIRLARAPSAANRRRAACASAGSVAGVAISTRRLHAFAANGNSVSIATVRSAGRPASAHAAVASSPRGAISTRLSARGRAASSRLAPSATASSLRAAWRGPGPTQTRAKGAEPALGSSSGTATAAPFS